MGYPPKEVPGTFHDGEGVTRAFGGHLHTGKETHRKFMPRMVSHLSTIQGDGKYFARFA